jgi:hypothetical protein
MASPSSAGAAAGVPTALTLMAGRAFAVAGAQAAAGPLAAPSALPARIEILLAHVALAEGLATRGVPRKHWL